MKSKGLTLGVYEDRWIYVRFLAESARQLITKEVENEVSILWYRLNDELREWTEAVKSGDNSLNQDPFGTDTLLIHLTRSSMELPGEKENLDWNGQSDIPSHLISTRNMAGRFRVINNKAERPFPNIIVVDHELFRPHTADTVSDEGSAHLIVDGLKKFYGTAFDTPPIFVSSYKALGGEIRLDTLGMGRGQGTRINWFPRPKEKQPTKLPDHFEEALWEEVGLWWRNRELLGARYGRSRWTSYSPPFDRVLVHYNRTELPLNEAHLKEGAEVVFRDHELSAGGNAKKNQDRITNADILLAQHCKAYLEIRREVTQHDVDRLRELAERFPLPIVLLYWNTSPNVTNLADCGVLTELVDAANGDLTKKMETAATDWIQKMAGLDTVVGGQRLREIRDDLLRWRLSSDTTRRGDQVEKPIGQALLVVGPTGAGKTAISKWCHFFSNHITHDDNAVENLWHNIPVPDPDHRGSIVPLKQACQVSRRRQNRRPNQNTRLMQARNRRFLRNWAKNMIEFSGGKAPKAQLNELLHTAFKTTGRLPRQVNLVGVTQQQDFVWLMCGAYPIWTDAQWPNDWKAGKILEATNNSLILNEIGELDSIAQGLLLELIERNGPIQPRFAPIGGEIKAKNVLFIMATDRVDHIRKQLVHRCRTIRVPSLLECQEDIPELARHRLLPRWCCLSERAEQILKDWPYWPGNHRSLHAVLDFAAERLPSRRRVIQAADIIRALWRENLFRVPSRLESLIKWILDWTSLNEDPPNDSVVEVVINRLAQVFPESPEAILDKFNRIADLTFETPSAHFTNPLGSKRVPVPSDPHEFVSKAVGLFIHEIFLTTSTHATSLQQTIEAAKQLPSRRLDAGSDGEAGQNPAAYFLDDALVTLSLGTLLWKILKIEPKDVAEANAFIRSFQPKPSGKRPKVGNGTASTVAESEVATTKTQTRKTKERVPNFDGAKISQTARLAGQYSLAVCRALDSTSGRTLFDYSEDRRARSYFAQGISDTEDDEENDLQI